MKENEEEFNNHCKLLESLSCIGNLMGSPYVDFEFDDRFIVLDGDFTIEDLKKIIAYKRNLINE